MHNIPRQDDDLEATVTKNIVHVLANVPADIAMSSIIKVLEATMVGSAKDKALAIRWVVRTSNHLKRQIRAKKDEEFGFLVKSASDEPIIPEGGFEKSRH